MIKSEQKGFTLVELLVVVAIIVALAAIVVPMTVRFASKGQEGASAGELDTVQTAMDAAMADELVRMSLRIGGADASVMGQVMRVQELDSNAYELALSFVDMDAETHELLEEYLREAEESGR